MTNNKINGRIIKTTSEFQECVKQTRSERSSHSGFEKIIILCFSFLTLCLAPPAHAQTISLSIWPPLLEAVIQPGKAITQVFKLKNLGDDTVIHASLVPFEPGDAFGHISLGSVLNYIPHSRSESLQGPTLTGRPALQAGSSERSDLNVLSFFSLQNADLDLPAIIPLKSGQTQEFVLKIKIPETAVEADHYFAFLFSADTQGLISASGTQTLGSIAANILMTVSQTGELHPTAKIEEFRVHSVPDRNDDPERNWVDLLDSFSPINFILKLKNTSSTRLKAIGQIEIKNTFNRLVATLPLREDNVLAHSSRYLTNDPWSPLFPLGRYTATATITPQNTTSQISQTIHFYVLPYKALLIIIGLFAIYLLTKKKLNNSTPGV